MTEDSRIPEAIGRVPFRLALAADGSTWLVDKD
jgi:hypothetical protein